MWIAENTETDINTLSSIIFVLICDVPYCACKLKKIDHKKGISSDNLAVVTKIIFRGL